MKESKLFRRNILYIIDRLGFGGAEKQLSFITKELKKLGYNQSVVVLNANVEMHALKAFTENGVPVKVIGYKRIIFFIGIVELCQLIRKQQTEILVTFLFASDFLGRIIGHLAKVPRIISCIRGHRFYFIWWQRILMRLTWRLVDDIVLNTQHLLSVIEGKGTNPEKITIIPNGIYCDQYIELFSKEKVHEIFQIPRNYFVIGSMGRLAPEKGFDILLKAFAQLSRIDVHLLIFGNGKLKDRLSNLALELGITNRVQLVSFNKDAYLFLNGVDVYVQPSHHEGVPNAILEAMAAGCPIIATAVGGNKELIINDVNGLLVPPNSIHSLSAAINLLLSDRKKAQKFALVAKKFVLNKFDISIIAKKWDTLFVKD